MSRFANPKATARFVLPGPCACPGQPHDEDWIELRTEMGTQDAIALGLAANRFERFKYLVVGWNLRDDDGNEAPVDEEHIDRLFLPDKLFEKFDAWANEHLRYKTLPNESAAPSRNGSRGSGGPARATRPRS